MRPVFSPLRSLPAALLALLPLPLTPLRAAESVKTVIQSARLDTANRFVVEADVPAGSRHAALEMLSPAASGAWRTMISGALDGRAAHVTFLLPRPAGAPTVLTRVRTGTEVAPPPAELTDPALFVVAYAGDTGNEQAKLTFLDQGGAKMREFANLPHTARQAALITWAETSPLVDDAMVSPTADNVCVRFKDGDICVFLNRPRTDGTTPANQIPRGQRVVHPEETGAAPAPPPAQQTAGAVEWSVPESNTAVSAYSLETEIFPNSAPTIASWLTAANYSTRTFGSTTVDEIKSWSSGAPLGVLFWHAHGCSYTKANGLEGVGIVTRHFATKELSQGAYKSMRDSGELLLAKDDTPNPPMYYITSLFVKKYMKFAPHSLVILDTCYAAHLELAGAFITAGAGAVAGWDSEGGVKSGTPPLKVFDRLTGSNAEPPISFPKERAFNLPVIRHWMRMFQYDIDPSPKYENQVESNARLLWQTHPLTPAYILKPSVMRVLVEASSQGEQFTKFLIEGDFGKDPGEGKRRLLWGGQEMNVLRWHQRDGIVIRAPGKPPAGSFQVSLFGRHHSNEMPFSEWTVPFVYELNGRGSLHYKVEMNVKMRADVHGSRGMPEQPVQYITIPFSHLADCTGQVTAKGSYSPDPDTVITWSGGTALHSLDPNTKPSPLLENLIMNGGVFNLMTGKTLFVHLTSTGTFTETVDGKSSKVGAAITGFEWPPLSFQLNLGSSALEGDSKTFSDPGSGVSAKLSWPTVIPAAAPGPDTAR